MSNFIDIIRAELKFVYGDIFRRKSVLIMFLAYPYVLTAFILLIGYSFGSPKVFVDRVGVDPAIFFITSGFMLLAILGVSDDIFWRPIFEEWMGTLPYIIASPVSRIQHYLAIPIPRLLLVLLTGSTSVVPVFTYFYGLSGFIESLVILGLTMIGAIFFASVSMVSLGIIYGFGGESWRIINVIRPLLLILIGAYYPRFLMPLLGKIISGLIPSSYVVEAIQRMLIDPSVPASFILMLLGIATALFVIYTPVGAKSIVFWEKKRVSEGVKT